MRFKYKIILSITLCMIIFLASILVLALSGSNSETVSSGSLEILDKIKTAELNGKEITLNNSDISDISSMYFKKSITKGNVKVKNLRLSMKDNLMIVNILFSYKKINLTFSSKGYVECNNGKVEYKPTSFKLGNLMLSKKLVMNFLKEYKNDKFIINDEKITISNSALPLKIIAITIANSEMNVKIEKNGIKNILNNIDNKQVNSSITNNSTTNKPNNSNNGNDSNNGNESNNGNDDNSYSKGSNNQISNGNDIESQNNSTNNNESSEIESLKQLSQNLSGAIASDSNPKGQQIIQMIKASVDRKISNPSYDVRNDSVVVKTQYNKLTPKEKKDVKNALLTNVDLSNASELQKFMN